MSLHLGPRHKWASRRCDYCAFLSEASDDSSLYTANIPFLIMFHPLTPPEDSRVRKQHALRAITLGSHTKMTLPVWPPRTEGSSREERIMDAAVPFILIWHSEICAQSAFADALGLLMTVLVSSASGLTRARFPPSQHLPLVPSFLCNARHSLTQGSHGGLLQSQFSRNVKPLFT
ncbi:hypothetical protein DFH09DRAFT_1356840 [Mycena vulgaris]|nr:hypothetical protein DFH09DRAFT_1356840 [Mycena vulgaris]